MPGQPVLTFLLGGGAWGIASHVIAIVRGVLEKPAMLRGASPVAAVTLAFFEFTFHWCLILTAALLLRRVWGRRTPPAASG